MADRASWGLAFGAGSLLTVLVLVTLEVGGGGTGVPVGSDGAAQRELTAELRALRQSVERLDGRLAQPADAGSLLSVAEAGPGRARSADLEPVLAEVAQAVGRLTERLDAASGEGLTAAGIRRARDTHRDVDWQAVQPLAQTMTRDRDAAKRAVRFLTPAELLARYGRPTDVWTHKGSAAITWHYGRFERVNGEERGVMEVSFKIQDGYVVDAWGTDAATEALLEADGD